MGASELESVELFAAKTLQTVFLTESNGAAPPRDLGFSFVLLDLLKER